MFGLQYQCQELDSDPPVTTNDMQACLELPLF